MDRSAQLELFAKIRTIVLESLSEHEEALDIFVDGGALTLNYTTSERPDDTQQLRIKL